MCAATGNVIFTIANKAPRMIQTTNVSVAFRIEAFSPLKFLPLNRNLWENLSKRNRKFNNKFFYSSLHGFRHRNCSSELMEKLYRAHNCEFASDIIRNVKNHWECSKRGGSNSATILKSQARIWTIIKLRRFIFIFHREERFAAEEIVP